MKKILNQGPTNPDSSNQDDALSPTSASKHIQEDVSIENFDQLAKNVRITERATIEAMNRLGYTNEDLSFRSIHEFKRPGCDDSVTKLLYTKYKNKRQKIIIEITEMREKVLDEKDQAKQTISEKNSPKNRARSRYQEQGNSPLVRIEMASIQKEKQNLRNLKIQKEKDLKKIVISQFRDYFQHQQHEEAMKKTIEKSEQIAQMKSEVIKTARAKASQPRAEPPQNNQQSSQQNSPLPKTISQSSLPNVERHLENYMRIRNEEAKKREEMRKKNEIHIKIAHERSIEQQEKIREDKLKKISTSEIRYQKWKDNQEQINQQRIEKFKTRQKYELSVCQNGIKIEEEMKNKKLQKINEVDFRSKNQTELYKSCVKSRLDNIRIKMNERSQKCQQQLDKQRIELEEYRKKLDERDLAIEAKLKKQNLDTTLKYLSRKIDRDDRIENAKRMKIRKDYLNESLNKKQNEDTRIASQLQIEKQKIMNEISSTDLIFRDRRDEILAEFKRMDNPDSPNCKKRIAKLLNVSVDDVNDLILFAKSSLGNYARPQTALQSTRGGSSLQYLSMKSNRSNSGSFDSDT